MFNWSLEHPLAFVLVPTGVFAHWSSAFKIPSLSSSPSLLLDSIVKTIFFVQPSAVVNIYVPD